MFNIQNSAHLLNGLEELHAIGLLLPNLSISAGELAQQLLLNLFDNSEKYTPLQLSSASDVLRMALSVLAQPLVLVTFLSDETVLEERSVVASVDAVAIGGPAAAGAKPAKRVVTKGGVFYANFQQQVCFLKLLSFAFFSSLGPHPYHLLYAQIDEHISTNFKQFARPLLSAFHKNAVMFRIVLNLLERSARVGDASQSQALLHEVRTGPCACACAFACAYVSGHLRVRLRVHVLALRAFQ